MIGASGRALPASGIACELVAAAMASVNASVIVFSIEDPSEKWTSPDSQVTPSN
jgi:hypothetical protein